MYQTLKKYFIFTVMAMSIGLVSGCSDSEQLNADNYAKSNATNATNLENKFRQLERNVNNRALKGKYEMVLSIALEKVSKENSDSDAVRDLVNAFRKDMTSKGTPFNALKDDYTRSVLQHKAYSLNGVIPADKKKIKNMKNLDIEMNRLSQAMTASTYDQIFIDYINTIAAISPSVEPVLVDKLSDDAAFGSQFVGNPNYGEWKQDSNGNSSWSFWQTYGMISFVDDMFFDNGRSYGRYGYNDYDRHYSSNRYTSSSSRYRYDNWNNTRNYSYYNDVYSKKYESNLTKSKTAAKTAPLKKKYASNLAKKTPASKQASKVNSNPKNKKFGSNLAKPKAKKSSNNNNGGSIKNSKSSSGTKTGGGK